MVTQKTLVVAFFPKNMPAEICLHEIIKTHSQLCSRSCHKAPIATTKDIVQQYADQEIIILNRGDYLSVFRTAEEIMKLIQQRWFREIAIVSYRHHAKRLKRDLERLYDGRIKIYDSIPQTRLRDFYLKGFGWRRAWTLVTYWAKEGIKKMLPWPAYTFLASR